jgi:hypothetical protein
MRIGPALGLSLLLLAAASLSGCGDEDEPPARPAATTTTSSGEIELKVEYDDGAGGGRRTGELVCRAGEVRTSGTLYDGRQAAALCSQARELTELLTTQPDKDRMCTQLYGGPETARVTGTINGKPVDRRFSRTNGCEIADFTAAAGLLQP